MILFGIERVIAARGIAREGCNSLWPASGEVGST